MIVYSRTSLPAGPLLDYFGDASAREIAERCGVTRRTVCRWRQGRGVEMSTAEDVCDRLDEYPSVIWLDWWAYVGCPSCDLGLDSACRCQMREWRSRRAS